MKFLSYLWGLYFLSNASPNQGDCPLTQHTMTAAHLAQIPKWKKKYVVELIISRVLGFWFFLGKEFSKSFTLK